jgi:hypothetical protein
LSDELHRPILLVLVASTSEGEENEVQHVIYHEPTRDISLSTSIPIAIGRGA